MTLVFRKKYYFQTLLFTGLVFFISCSSSVRFSSKKTPAVKPPSAVSKDSQLSEISDSWLGVPYRYGGFTRSGIDCSGLTCRIFQEAYNIGLSRTVDEQIKGGRFVRKEGLKRGDLLFFRNGGTGLVDHVGIYLKEGRFVHASTERGVIISDLNTKHYLRRFVTARRYLP